MIQILIAPNAFKNSLSAQQAALALQEGFARSQLECTTECFPIADGGDGTAELIVDRLGGTRVDVSVRDPFGRTINTSFGLINEGRTAVIEMADASGLRLLNRGELNPLKATSYGTGQMIKAALDQGVKEIVIAMGGSATVDGGTGILSALGIRFLDSNGAELSLPGDLTKLGYIDLTSLDHRIANCEFIVLCDVDNKLLGEQGAAAIFGPQKGAGPDDIKLLDACLTRFNELTLRETGKDMSTVKYGGAAGGASSGVYAYLGAKLVNGIDYFMDITNFNVSLDKANFVITGEGSIDEQTLQGKGPYGVASRAKLKAIPVIGIAGKVPLESNAKLNEYFKVLMAIGNEPMDIPKALSLTRENLIRVGRDIGELINFSK